MKKILTFLIVSAFFLFTNISFAQTIVFGEEALNNGEYEKAQGYFDEIIRDGAKTQPFELALAYYYRAWTWIKLYGSGPADIANQASDPAGEMLLNAYNDLLSSLSQEDGRLTKRINDLMVQLEPGLMQYGLVMVNRAEDQKAAGKAYKSSAEKAVGYLHPAAGINSSYLAYDLLGQAFMILEDHDKALEMFTKSTNLYRKDPPDQPDFMIGYAFFRMGYIYRDQMADENQCMDALQSGKRLLDEEYRRYLNAKSASQTAQNKRMEADYNRVMNDLHTLELETLLRSETRLAEAQAVFKSEMAQRPEDVNVVIAYASLFEKTDPEEAIKYYKIALEKDPSSELAAYNLAVVNYNQGQKFFNTGIRDEDQEKQAVNISRAQEYFRQARPVFERILEKDPSDLETVTILKNISFALDDMKGFERYQKMEEGL